MWELVVAVLYIVVPAALLFGLVYLAVRLAIRHSR
jgi:hypothetical protein